MARSASERLEMRLRPEVERRLRAAAEHEHVTLSAFVTSAALARADEVLREQHTWEVDVAYFDRMVVALDSPPVRNAALAKAAAEADELLERR